MGVSRCRNLDVIDFWGYSPSSFPWFSLSASYQAQSASFLLGDSKLLRSTERERDFPGKKKQLWADHSRDWEATWQRHHRERELCNWLSIYVFQNTVSQYPTSQGDKKESFSVQACYIAKKAHGTRKDRARRQRPKSCTAQAFSDTLSCHR